MADAGEAAGAEAASARASPPDASPGPAQPQPDDDMPAPATATAPAPAVRAERGAEGEGASESKPNGAEQSPLVRPSPAYYSYAYPTVYGQPPPDVAYVPVPMHSVVWLPSGYPSPAQVHAGVAPASLAPCVYPGRGPAPAFVADMPGVGYPPVIVYPQMPPPVHHLPPMAHAAPLRPPPMLEPGGGAGYVVLPSASVRPEPPSAFGAAAWSASPESQSRRKVVGGEVLAEAGVSDADAARGIQLLSSSARSDGDSWRSASSASKAHCATPVGGGYKVSKDGARKYVCSNCGKSYRGRSGLFYHTKMGRNARRLCNSD